MRRLTSIALVALLAVMAWPHSAETQVRLRLRHRADPPTDPPPGTLYGQQAVACPSGAVFLSVGTALQSAINGQPAGTTFCLGAGVHRLQSITPRNGDQFYGQPGAILSGAEILTGWTQSGSTWWVGGRTQDFGGVNPIERCQLPAYPRCDYPQDLWIDGLWYQQVDSIAAVTPTTWHFDYGADRIYIGTNPAGRTVETSVTSYAFSGSATNVRIQNLQITRYANPSQSGAVHGQDGGNWTLQYNDIVSNHAYAVRTGSGMQVRNNRLNSQGQLGIGGPGTTVLVDTNEIAFNNVNGYLPGWEAGGSKWALTTGLTVRLNYVHHNNGHALWTDIDNFTTLYENNTVEDNTEAGIFHEISYDFTIRNNTVRRNGSAFHDWLWGAGIQIAASGHALILSEVYGNVVEDNGNGIVLIQQNRGTGVGGPWIVQNVLVRDNIVRMTIGASGAVRDNGVDDIWNTLNNHFENNTYFGSSTCTRFEWAGSVRTFAAWQGYGNDDTGSCTTF